MLELLGLGAGGQPDLVAPIDQRGYELLGTGQGVPALLQLGVVFAVELAHPLGLLIVLDEHGDQLVRALAHLVVDPRSWRACPHLFEGLRPGLDGQVVGVHERPVYVPKHSLYQSYPPHLSRLASLVPTSLLEDVGVLLGCCPPCLSESSSVLV